MPHDPTRHHICAVLCPRNIIVGASAIGFAEAIREACTRDAEASHAMKNLEQVLIVRAEDVRDGEEAYQIVGLTVAGYRLVMLTGTVDG